MSLAANLDNFVRNIGRNIDLFHKDAATEVNKRMLNVAYKAAAATPVETSAEISQSLTRDPHLLAALASIRQRAQGGGTLPKGEFKKLMANVKAGRRASARYLRSAWAKAIADLGGTFRGSNVKPSGAKRTSHSSATKATVASLLSTLTWEADEPSNAKATGAEDVAQKALETGLANEAEALADHIADKLAKAFK